MNSVQCHYASAMKSGGDVHINKKRKKDRKEKKEDPEKGMKRTTLKWVAEKPIEKSNTSSIDDCFLLKLELFCSNTKNPRRKITPQMTLDAIVLMRRLEKKRCNQNEITTKSTYIKIIFFFFFFSNFFVNAFTLEKQKS